MPQAEKARVFMSGRSQAVRIPAEFRFSTKEVYIRRDPQTGDLILSQSPNSWDEIFATLDAAEIDLSRAFEKGMGYVALSRVKSLKNISLIGFNQTALEVSDRIKKIDAEFWENSAESEAWLKSFTPEKLKRAQEDFLESAKTKSADEGRASSDELRYEIEDIPVIDFE